MDKWDRFWSNVDVRGPDECWEWQGWRYPNGYGGLNRHDYAHRVAYKLLHCCIPDGRFVLHHCDNPACCSPYHLFSGTHQDNMDDMTSKGRGAIGERHGMAKLTETDALAIAQSAESPNELVARYGVERGAILAIRRGDSWSEVTGVTDGRNYHKLTPEDVVEIRRLRASGLKLKEIAPRFGVHWGHISHVCRGKSWKDVGDE